MRKDAAGRGSRSNTPTWEASVGFVRGKAHELIQQILEKAVTELLGRGKPRHLVTSIGTPTVRRPQVRGLEERFESRVLPLSSRRTKEVGALLPELYLDGLADMDFELAVRGLLCEETPRSKATTRRLREGWAQGCEASGRRSLKGRKVVKAWAHGIYMKAGLERDMAALLVVIAAMRGGTKEVVAIVPGHRESTESWTAVLRDLMARGLDDPMLPMADGNPTIGAAARKVWPKAGEQRCWNHKMRYVLDRLPKRELAAAKELLQARGVLPDAVGGDEGREAFKKRYGPWYPKAVAALESVRLSTTAAKRFKRVEGATPLMWKLLMVAEKRFRTLDAPHLLREVFDGRKFEDGKPVLTQQRKAAA